MEVTPELLFDKDQILQHLYAAQPISPAGTHLTITLLLQAIF
jgi:hypothetical protein